MAVVSQAAPGSAVAVKIDNVSKVFGQRGVGTVALENMSLDIADREFVAVVGPSGCGKSTLMQMVGGLTPVTSGSIHLRGVPVTKPVTDVGIVFQKDLLLDWRTILGNVLLQCELRGKRGPDWTAAARRWLAKVGLEGFEDKRPWQLSGGMRQRVSIVRALIHNPGLLLMDEPFGALDALTREQMMVQLQDLWLGSPTTVMFITHSIMEAVFLADRVVVLTPRPARIETIVKIDLPRPRTAAVFAMPEFSHYTEQIREAFQRTGVL